MPSDCLFLAGLVGLSVLPYIGGLGFYSDDWNWLGQFATSGDQSVLGLLERQWDFSTELRARPTQIAYQALLYRAFGLDPLGYHVVNAGFLAATTILFYCALRAIGFPRLLATAIPSLYVVLPHFSATRFWFTAFGYTIAVGFAFLSLYANVRGLGAGSRPHLWKLLALGSVGVSGLSYEVMVPMLVVSPLLAVAATRRGGVSVSRRRAAVYVASDALLLLVIVGYKLAFLPQGGVPELRELAKLAFTVVAPNLGTYGLGLPQATGWAVTASSLSALALGGVAAAAVFARLLWLQRIEPGGAEVRAGAGGWSGLAASGVLVFLLGYAPFLLSGGRFTPGASSSYGNRIATAGTIGVAIVLVGLIGAFTGRLRRPSSRPLSFAFAVALLCLASFLITARLGRDPVHAWTREKAVLREIERRVPRIEPRTTVILRGACPYVGSAIVFERLDFEGALQVLYGDDSIRGDVGSKLSMGPDQLLTTAVGYVGRYSYGPRLLAVDVARDEVARLPTREAALAHFGRPKLDWPPHCPEGAPDIAVPLFPVDKFYTRHVMRSFP